MRPEAEWRHRRALGDGDCHHIQAPLPPVPGNRRWHRVKWQRFRGYTGLHWGWGSPRGWTQWVGRNLGPETEWQHCVVLVVALHPRPPRDQS